MSLLKIKIAWIKILSWFATPMNSKVQLSFDNIGHWTYRVIIHVTEIYPQASSYFSFWDRVTLSCLGWSFAHFVAQAGLNPGAILLYLLKQLSSWNYRLCHLLVTVSITVSQTWTYKSKSAQIDWDQQGLQHLELFSPRMGRSALSMHITHLRSFEAKWADAFSTLDSRIQ